MKKNLIFPGIMLNIFIMLNAGGLTVYNNNLGLVKSEKEFEFKKGRHEYFLNETASEIIPASLIIYNKNKNLKLLSQSYEYDLAGTDAILEKYIGEEIIITAGEGKKFIGELVFYSGMIGVQDKLTGELNLISRDKIETIRLKKLPENFFAKPALRWEFYSNINTEEKISYSYLTRGIEWNVMYNGVLKGNKLALSAWVTIYNNSGKDFNKTDLKLVAGEVNQEISGGKALYMEEYALSDAGSPLNSRSFSQKEFHDFHIYELDSEISVKNKQEKQVSLFAGKEADIEVFCQYSAFDKRVNSYLRFKNNKKSGLGIPLPKGICRIYMQDGEEIEFIGEDNIAHTSENEEVKILTGQAFDVIGETKVIDRVKLGKGRYRESIDIEVRNNSEKAKSIEVLWRKGNKKILKSDTKFQETDAFHVKFKFKLNGKENKKIRFTAEN
ncbi:MAG: hypothetical protein CSB55_07505 [Candidatus Cloacimonadota bacterium]|nr:MAG: hypothetical protein CSB55_07505 [Candidatus Cloacimonadota bacterium]